MDRFKAEGGQFWLNGQPQLIQAGELHYFRIPPDQWRHRLNLLKEAGFNTVAAYIPWIWHQLAEDESDLDGHSHPMRDLAGFLDLAAEMGLLIIARPGPYIMAETINEGIPPWVFSKYPQAAFISQDHRIQNVASYLQADFLACIKKWYQAVFKVLAPRQVSQGGRIIMIQLDNEMGMIQWVRNILDINPDTITRFAAWLKTAYSNSVPGRYPVENLEEFLLENLANPVEAYGEKIVADYRQFYREYLRQYASFLWSEAKANGMDVLPVVNVHGFMNGGKTFPIGLSQLISIIRMDGMLTATDVYPIFIGEGNYHQLLLLNEITKALQNPAQPLFSIEFQAGGNNDFSGNQASLYDLHSRLCISSGMRAINHYLFFDGENDPILSPTRRHDWGHPVRKDGTLRRHYHRYPKLSNVLKAYGEDLILARPKTVAAVGFFLDHFMTEVNNEFSRKPAGVITHQREVILFDLIGRGLALTQRPFSAVDLESSSLDATQTPLCWVMLERQCRADVQQKLVDYLHAGGKLILAGRMCVEDADHQPCTILKDAIGIGQIAGGEPFVQGTLSAFQDPEVPVSFLETYAGEFDQVFARSQAGGAAGFIKRIGKGQVLVLGAALAANTLADLEVFDQMAERMGCQPLFKLSSWADVRVSQGQNGSFLFINNYQDDPLETTIEMDNRPLFGGSPICLPARRGAILPLEWWLSKDVLLHYATCEIVERVEDGGTIRLKTEQAEFFAEMTLAGYSCENSTSIAELAGARRVRLHGKDGVILIKKDGE